MGIEGRIREFLIEDFMVDGDSFNYDDSFLELGLIDSTGVLELVAFVEEAFDITVADQEIVPDNFDSINRLTRFIRRRRGSERLVEQPARHRVPLPAGVA